MPFAVAGAARVAWLPAGDVRRSVAYTVLLLLLLPATVAPVPPPNGSSSGSREYAESRLDRESVGDGCARYCGDLAGVEGCSAPTGRLGMAMTLVGVCVVLLELELKLELDFSGVSNGDVTDFDGRGGGGIGE